MKYMPSRQVFSGCEKILQQLPADATPLDFFKLYFTDDVIDLLVVETNRYAHQYISNNVVPPHSAVNEWHATDHNETFAFLGLCVLMEIVYKPMLTMYWSSDMTYKTGIFGQTMARDRFLLLPRFFAFCRQ